MWYLNRIRYTILKWNKKWKEVVSPSFIKENERYERKISTKWEKNGFRVSHPNWKERKEEKKNDFFYFPFFFFTFVK